VATAAINELRARLCIIASSLNAEAYYGQLVATVDSDAWNWVSSASESDIAPEASGILRSLILHENNRAALIR